MFYHVVFQWIVYVECGSCKTSWWAIKHYSLRREWERQFDKFRPISGLVLWLYFSNNFMKTIQTQPKHEHISTFQGNLRQNEHSIRIYSVTYITLFLHPLIYLQLIHNSDQWQANKNLLLKCTGPKSPIHGLCCAWIEARTAWWGVKAFPFTSNCSLKSTRNDLNWYNWHGIHGNQKTKELINKYIIYTSIT